ncbi:MAG: PEP-utilizing enzyme, partial [Cyanobium sp.]
DELVSLYRRIEAELLSHWDAPLINDFYAMIFYGTLRHLSRRWCSEQEASALHDWIAGDASVISAEPPRRIRAMALLLLRRPELIDVLRNGQAPAQRRALASCPELETEVERYLDDFGDRCLEELKLETLTLREDPLPLLRSIGAMATRLQQDPGIHPHPPSAEPPAAGDTCAPLLPGHPLRRLVLRWLQRRTRALVSNRENLRFERTRVFGLARRLLLELGRHLAELELLERPEDVLFLEVEEALGIVEGNGSSSDLRGLVAVRRAAWQRQRQQPPLPRRLETHGLPCLDTATLVSAPPEGEGGLPPDAGSGWQGTGCAPGRVRARVSLVRDPRLWLETPADQRGGCPILVAGSTDPGWVLLFPHAAGLLVERGSVLSHVAIVARELGLPMVSDLGGITGHLREGDIVEMDGRSGTVIRVEDSAMAAVEAPVP